MKFTVFYIYVLCGSVLSDDSIYNVLELLGMMIDVRGCVNHLDLYGVMSVILSRILQVIKIKPNLDRKGISRPVKSVYLDKIYFKKIAIFYDKGFHIKTFLPKMTQDLILIKIHQFYEKKKILFWHIKRRYLDIKKMFEKTFLSNQNSFLTNHFYILTYGKLALSNEAFKL